MRISTENNENEWLWAEFLITCNVVTPCGGSPFIDLVARCTENNLFLDVANNDSKGLFALQKFDMTPKGTCNAQTNGDIWYLAENSKNMLWLLNDSLLRKSSCFNFSEHFLQIFPGFSPNILGATVELQGIRINFKFALFAAGR